MSPSFLDTYLFYNVAVAPLLFFTHVYNHLLVVPPPLLYTRSFAMICKQCPFFSTDTYLKRFTKSASSPTHVHLQICTSSGPSPPLHTFLYNDLLTAQILFSAHVCLRRFTSNASSPPLLHMYVYTIYEQCPLYLLYTCMFKVRLRWLGAVLQYPCKSMFFVLYFNILMIIIHH